MKEIGKLIELYYEHKLDLLKRDMRGNGATEREIELADIEKVDEEELEENLNKLSELKPFIKWLVENDKIDFEGMSGHANIIKYLRDVKKCNRNQIKEGVVLMLLSISDTPIEDLISYLK